MDANGPLFCPPEARPHTLCNCDCKILTTTVPVEVRKFSQECTHPSKKLCTKRTMTDIISEIETAASAHRACSADDSGILLTDFVCAFSSVDHSWILHVLQRANIPDGLRNILQRNSEESLANVEHACAVSGKFLMAHSVRQGSLASLFLVA